MTRVVALVVLMGVAPLAMSTASADETDAAKHAYQEAVRLYDLGDYAAALAGFRRVYMQYESSALLYNIAQCHRALGQLEDALTMYRKYIQLSPGLSEADRNEVDKAIADIESRLQQRKRDQQRQVDERANAALAQQQLDEQLRVAARQKSQKSARVLRDSGAVTGGVGVLLVVGAAVLLSSAGQISDELTRAAHAGAVWDPGKASTGETDQNAGIGLIVIGAVAVATGVALVTVGQLRLKRQPSAAAFRGAGLVF